MGKLTRRKRKELQRKTCKQNSKNDCKSEVRASAIPRKKHTCLFHKYQEQSDGTFVCQICGHHFERKMDDAELRKYMYMNKEYSLKALREMKFCVVEVIYGRDGRGIIYEHEVRELYGQNAIEAVADIWKYFRCINDDLHFMEEGLLSVDLPFSNGYRKCNTEDIWTPSFEQLEKIFDQSEKLDIEEFWDTAKEWCYKTPDGKMHLYKVYPVLNGRLTEFRWEHYLDADSTTARKYVFSQNGELEKAMIRFGNGEIYSLSK